MMETLTQEKVKEILKEKIKEVIKDLLPLSFMVSLANKIPHLFLLSL